MSTCLHPFRNPGCATECRSLIVRGENTWSYWRIVWPLAVGALLSTTDALVSMGVGEKLPYAMDSSQVQRRISFLEIFLIAPIALYTSSEVHAIWIGSCDMRWLTCARVCVNVCMRACVSVVRVSLSVKRNLIMLGQGTPSIIPTFVRIVLSASVLIKYCGGLEIR